MAIIKTTKAYLTPKQKSILLFVADHMERLGFAPTQQEIADSLGLGRPLVKYHLAVLERSGYLKSRGLKRRNLIVLNKV